VKTYTIIGCVNGVGKSSFTGVFKEFGKVLPYSDEAEFDDNIAIVNFVQLVIISLIGFWSCRTT